MLLKDTTALSHSCCTCFPFFVCHVGDLLSTNRPHHAPPIGCYCLWCVFAHMSCDTGARHPPHHFVVHDKILRHKMLSLIALRTLAVLSLGHLKSLGSTLACRSNRGCTIAWVMPVGKSWSQRFLRFRTPAPPRFD